jgi:Ethanolamine utilization protein EutJ (predicted chaperonin)
MQVLEITPQARVELRQMLEIVLAQNAFEQEDATLGFRLVAADEEDEETGLGLTVDSVRAGDAVFDHDGRPVLLMDGVAAILVDGLVLDIIDTVQGRRLALRDALGDRTTRPADD